MLFTGNYALAVWWLLFFSMHSGFASGKIKTIVFRFGNSYRIYYRAVYNLLSIILLFPVLYTYLNTVTIWVFNPNGFSTAAGVLISLSGLFIIKDSFKNYNTAEFLGTYQIRKKQDYKPQRFSSTGWNSIVRHPLYFGSIILIIGFFIATPAQKMAVSALLGLTYLLIGTYWEEQKLSKEFGVSYRDYQKKVSMLLPIKYLANKLQK